jgi:hypothetical protein
MGTQATARTVVLVEGVSDRLAVEALAARLGRDLAAEGVAVVPMGGSKNVRASVERYGPRGSGLRLAGLVDQNEEGDVRRALEGAGLGSGLSRADLEALGFFVCVRDLEDELIRALGAEAVERVVEAQGELARFRKLQGQPAWRGQPHEEQLRRFFGAGSGRKARVAPALVAALDLGGVPRPLAGLLASL